jgi:L-alanine-DL-glutamate epimerase-like enolase superfamily enzyme
VGPRGRRGAHARGAARQRQREERRERRAARPRGEAARRALYRLWGLDPARAPRSSFTIALAPDDAALAARVAEADAYPILKVKLGSPAGPARDAEVIRRVRELAPAKVLRVDANAAWSPKQAVRMSAVCDEVGVEFVEQPVAAGDVEGLRFVRRTARCPWWPTSRA